MKDNYKFGNCEVNIRDIEFLHLHSNFKNFSKQVIPYLRRLLFYRKIKSKIEFPNIIFHNKEINNSYNNPL